MKKLISLVSAICICGLGVGLVSACEENPIEDSPEEEHIHSYTSEVTTPATCTEDGVMTYTCECGDSYTESIPATGHIWGGTIYSIGENSGNVIWTRTCLVCGEPETLTEKDLTKIEDFPVFGESIDGILKDGLTAITPESEDDIAGVA